MSGSPLSRRGLLLTAGALTAAGLSGCDLDPSTHTPADHAPPDPDLALVTAARAELSRLITALGDGAATAALVGVHRVQLAALQGDPPPPSTRPTPLTRQQTIAREVQAVKLFTRWANAAENGDLARVLASIAAGIRVQPVLRGAL